MCPNINACPNWIDNIGGREGGGVITYRGGWDIVTTYSNYFPLNFAYEVLVRNNLLNQLYVLKGNQY